MLQNAFILIFFVICNVSTIFKFHYNNSVPPFSILIQLYSHSSSCKHSGHWQTRSQVPPLDPPQHARCPSQGSPSITQKTCLKQKKQIPPSALPTCETGPFEHSLASVSHHCLSATKGLGSSRKVWACFCWWATRRRTCTLCQVKNE